MHAFPEDLDDLHIRHVLKPFGEGFQVPYEVPNLRIPLCGTLKTVAQFLFEVGGEAIIEKCVI